MRLKRQHFGFSVLHFIFLTKCIFIGCFQNHNAYLNAIFCNSTYLDLDTCQIVYDIVILPK